MKRSTYTTEPIAKYDQGKSYLLNSSGRAFNQLLRTQIRPGDQKSKRNIILQELQKRNIAVNLCFPEINPDMDPEGLMKYFNESLDPVLNIPVNCPLNKVKRLVYLTDIRYCDLKVMEKIAELARTFQAHVFILHVPANGLPDLPETALNDIYKETLYPRMQYADVSLLNLKKTDLKLNLNTCLKLLSPDIVGISWRNNRMYNSLFPKDSDRKLTSIPYSLLVFPPVS